MVSLALFVSSFFSLLLRTSKKICWSFFCCCHPIDELRRKKPVESVLTNVIRGKFLETPFLAFSFLALRSFIIRKTGLWEGFALWHCNCLPSSIKHTIKPKYLTRIPSWNAGYMKKACCAHVLLQLNYKFLGKKDYFHSCTHYSVMLSFNVLHFKNSVGGFFKRVKGGWVCSLAALVSPIFNRLII